MNRANFTNYTSILIIVNSFLQGYDAGGVAMIRKIIIELVNFSYLYNEITKIRYGN